MPLILQLFVSCELRNSPAPAVYQTQYITLKPNQNDVGIMCFNVSFARSVFEVEYCSFLLKLNQKVVFGHLRCRHFDVMTGLLPVCFPNLCITYLIVICAYGLRLCSTNTQVPVFIANPRWVFGWSLSYMFLVTVTRDLL